MIKEKVTPNPELLELLNVMSLEEVAYLVGVASGTVNRWKIGNNKPHKTFINKIKAIYASYQKRLSKEEKK